jgi:hypothetical protein
VVIGLACAAAAGGFMLESGSAPTPMTAVLGWLGFINLALAAFNLIPGFPLDGGRILRAIAWRVTHSQEKGTRIAARTGMVFAFLFILLGLFRLLTGGDLGGLWLAFIGWFLLDAAQAQYAATVVTSKLAGIRVADVMAHDCPAVEAGMTLQEFVDRELVRSGERCYAVRRGADIVGFVTPADIKTIDRAAWTQRTIGDLVPPVDAEHAVPPEAPAATALTLMGRENMQQVPVVANGHVAGVVTRAHLLQVLQLRAELS